VAGILTKLGVAVALKDFMVQNMVATTDCGVPIRLEGIADDELQRENCSVRGQPPFPPLRPFFLHPPPPH